MTISKDKVRANLIIDKELKKKIEQLALKDNRSFNNFVITVLEELVKEKE